MFNSFMNIAVEEAVKAFDQEEVPVGALIVRNEEVLIKAHNNMRKLHDPTAHSEMIVIRKASELLGRWQLYDCDIYVSLEPCYMCAAAISLARIRRLYFGSFDHKFGGTQYFETKRCHHKPDIYQGFCEQESARLMKKFFKDKR